MHLEATRDADFEIANGCVSMIGGETLQTENSLKYGLRAVGWSPCVGWGDQAALFPLILATVGPAHPHRASTARPMRSEIMESCDEAGDSNCKLAGVREGERCEIGVQWEQWDE